MSLFKAFELRSSKQIARQKNICVEPDIKLCLNSLLINGLLIKKRRKKINV